MNDWARIFWKYKIDQILVWVLLTVTHAALKTYLIDAMGWGYYLQEIIVRNLLLAILVYTIFYFIDRSQKENKIGNHVFLIILSIVLVFFYALFKSMHDSYLVGYTLGYAPWQPVSHRLPINFAYGF